MTPTPNFRYYTITLEKRVHWALRTISKGLIGDGQYKAELTPDGIATTLLVEAIETKWPGLLDGHRKRESVDSEYVELVAKAAIKAASTKEK